MAGVGWSFLEEEGPAIGWELLLILRWGCEDFPISWLTFLGSGFLFTAKT